MKVNGKTIGVAFTGSFCTFSKIFPELENLTAAGANVIPIFSPASASIVSRFGEGKEFLQRAEAITGHTPICTIEGAEPIGPKSYLDLLAIFPCTGNTAAKLANGITDTPVLMAAKAHLRNEKPLLLSISTNDALGLNMKNIGLLLNSRNIYFVPFGQDNPEKKPNSMIADVRQFLPSIEAALDGRQLQPIIKSPL